jgi:hypothetical protein
MVGGGCSRGVGAVKCSNEVRGVSESGGGKPHVVRRWVAHPADQVLQFPMEVAGIKDLVNLPFLGKVWAEKIWWGTCEIWPMGGGFPIRGEKRSMEDRVDPRRPRSRDGETEGDRVDGLLNGKGAIMMRG